MHRNQAVKLPTGLRQCGGSCPGPRHRATILSHPRWSPLGGRGRCTTATSSCPSPPWGTRTPILVHTTHEPSTPRLALGRGCPRPRPGGLSGAALLLRRCPYRTIWVHFSYHSADDAPPERRRDRQKSRPVWLSPSNGLTTPCVTCTQTHQQAWLAKQEVTVFPTPMDILRNDSES